MYRDNMTGIW